MRIWSIHPKYLDVKGLLAVWRETLLAKHVLEGKTKGYVNHPQLIRFKKENNPLEKINYYLKEVWNEAEKRGYSFSKEKFSPIQKTTKIKVTSKQLAYEWQHLLKKLEGRDPARYATLSKEKNIEVHPLFQEIPGEVEMWEKQKEN